MRACVVELPGGRCPPYRRSELAARRCLRASNLNRKSIRTDDAKVFVEAVTDEDAAEIDEQAELLVGHLERDERVSRALRVEIASWRRQSLSDELRTHAGCLRTR